MPREPKTVGYITATRVGTINRKIEESVSRAVSGGKGGMGQAIRFAKEREALLAPRPFRKKEPA